MDEEFLQQWLTESSESKRLFEDQKLSHQVLSEQALRHGYRTRSVWLDAMKDHHAALTHFVHANEFKELWAILKKHDEIYEEDRAYSAGRRGVPNRLLEAVDAWHQFPKFTIAERMMHSKKIAKACAQLQDLLGQVLPGIDFESQYSKFIFARDRQANAVFRVFKSEPIYEHGVIFEAGHRLKQCGVTPLWAINNIQKMAESEVVRNALPTKIRAATAKKTYLIGAVSKAIDSACVSELPKNIGLTHRLIADVVGLLAGMECEIEDVRKRLAQLEDSS